MHRPVLHADLDAGGGRNGRSGAAVEHRVLLGDESVAVGALHAGVSATYAYPGLVMPNGNLDPNTPLHMGAIDL